MNGEIELPTPDEVADLLRLVKFTLDRSETAMVAFIDSRYLDAARRDIERVGEMKKQVKAMLDRLPPEPPMSPEREQAIGNLLGAVLDKRFGGGSQEAVDEAIQAALSGSPVCPRCGGLKNDPKVMHDAKRGCYSVQSGSEGAGS